MTRLIAIDGLPTTMRSEDLRSLFEGIVSFDWIFVMRDVSGGHTLSIARLPVETLNQAPRIREIVEAQAAGLDI